MVDDDKLITFAAKGYKLIRPIGKGATGNTYVIRDEALSEDFVCKKYVTFPSLQIDYYQRFVEEIKILYKVSHPNIVRIFTYYLYPTEYTGYIVMEYIHGIDIAAFIKNSPDLLDTIFEQVIEGFCYLEEVKILHRDIRPANILVTTEGQVKIIDFGFSKQQDTPSDNSKSITLNWIASTPEEFSKQIYDHKSDIYFVGHLFEEIINENGLAEKFKYGEVLKLMTSYSYDSRIDSFAEIRTQMQSSKYTLIEFSYADKMNYKHFSEAFDSVISGLDNTATFQTDPSKIAQQLNVIVQKNVLEDYIQDSRDIINLFVIGPYSYYKKMLFPVSAAKNFYKWWISLSDTDRRIVLSNLSSHLNRIPRSAILSSDDLPF